MNLGIEKELLWIIPPKIDHFNKVVTFPTVLGRTHLDYYKNFCDKHKLEHAKTDTDLSYGMCLAKQGFCSVINSGHPIENKYFAIFCLPEQMTINQIYFFEQIKSLLYEKYNSSLIETNIITSHPLPYKGPYRCLSIEAKIGANRQDKLSLLYGEIENQKDLIKPKSI